MKTCTHRPFPSCIMCETFAACQSRSGAEWRASAVTTIGAQDDELGLDCALVTATLVLLRNLALLRRNKGVILAQVRRVEACVRATIVDRQLRNVCAHSRRCFASRLRRSSSPSNRRLRLLPRRRLRCGRCSITRKKQNLRCVTQARVLDARSTAQRLRWPLRERARTVFWSQRRSATSRW